jgi:2-hydroxychromene-2-carboxylate isomerase
MKQVTFWVDVISPCAYLDFERLPRALDGLDVTIHYRPVPFASLLGQWGQKGPAAIEPKRAWMFRQVAWLAHRHGVALQTPAQHPFNPLALLRLATRPPEG